jgi:aspartyl-tRNA(Asn)/glutamyl-tRNA(Gln) amidotransferase subunit B
MATAELVTTIGLEIHVELSTKTKLFCSCPVEFGGEPNTRVCPVCLGHPGTLPVTNEAAVEFATKIGMALGCRIEPRSIFNRKNYFYPDMPKNYQISQYDIPLATKGALEIEVDGTTKTIGITRVHLEEDTGKSIHVGGGGRIHEAQYSLEDYNRAGTPLVEIVTEPDLSSPEEARVFVSDLRQILEYLGVSDVRMEEGSMRVDANISVAPPGEPGIKAEVKNLNSIRSLQRALAYEQDRQRDLLSSGETMEQSTRHWDEKAGVTSALRTKEYAFDYRYFPEPDLVPLEPSVEWLRQLSEELPELPVEHRKRLEERFGLQPKVARVLTESSATARYFEEGVSALKRGEPKQLANWIANELAGLLAAKGDVIEGGPTPAALARLIDLVAEGLISSSQAKAVLEEMVSSGKSPDNVVSEQGLSQVSDKAELQAVVDEVIAANADVAERIRAGDMKPMGHLMGQVMKATGGQANPKLVNELIRERLSG